MSRTKRQNHGGPTGRAVRRLSAWVAAVVATAVLPCVPARAGDWPCFRGPDHNAVSAERIHWPPKKLWSAKVGSGHTSPILAGGTLYVMGWSGPGRRGQAKGTDTVFAFDARTGKPLWRQSYAAPAQPRHRAGDLNRYRGPHGTCAYDGRTKYLFTLGLDGDLRCWDTARQGRLVWAVNLYDRFGLRRRPKTGGGVRDFGYTNSPLVLGKWVVLEVGGKAGTVAAFDTRIGRKAWSSEYAGFPGHTPGPVPLTVQGKPAVVVLALTEMVVISAAEGTEGKTLAKAPWSTDWGCNIAAPAVAGERVLITSAYNRKTSCLFDVRAARPRVLWTSRANAIVSTPLIHDGRAYLVDGPLQCLDLTSGKMLWRGGSFGSGTCLMTAGHRLLVHGRGRLTLVDASPKVGRFQSLGEVRTVSGAQYPQVALSDGILACKNRQGDLVVFDVAPLSAASGAKTTRP